MRGLFFEMTLITRHTQHSPRWWKRPTDDGDRRPRRVLDHEAEESIVGDARAEFGCAVGDERGVGFVAMREGCRQIESIEFMQARRATHL